MNPKYGTDMVEHIGHNEPPTPIDYEFETLNARTVEIKEIGNRWITDRPEIKTEEEAFAATLFIKQVNQHKKAVETERKARNQPLRDKIQGNNDEFAALSRPLEIAAAVVKAVLGDYLAAKSIAADARRERRS